MQKIPDIELKIFPISNRRNFLVEDGKERIPIFSNLDDLNGEVLLHLKEDSSFEHTGLTLELIGKLSKKIKRKNKFFLYYLI